MKKVTILDVANHAGVSKATVSRVINHNPRVKNEIKERVLHSIRELNYFPSAIARNLSNNTSNVIGLILPDITNPYFPTIARGIEDVVHSIGCSLFICNTDNDPYIEQEYIQQMRSQQVKGIILISSILDKQKIIELKKHDIPFVLCDRFLPDTSFDTVSIDDYKAAYDAVNYLIKKGHGSICHLSGPLHVQSAELRKKGYLDCIKRNNLKASIRIGNFSFETGYQMMESVLNEEDFPTAVFAANDLMALGAMNAIKDWKFEIPKDISIIGMDNISFSQMCSPKLTTISIPAYQMGISAMELLIERIKGVRGTPVNLILEHTIIERET